MSGRVAAVASSRCLMATSRRCAHRRQLSYGTATATATATANVSAGWSTTHIMPSLRVLVGVPHYRQSSSGTTTAGRPTINMPSSQTSTSWERGAKLVKNTDKSNEYLDTIRQTTDPGLHLKTIEDELRGTMGKALGKQGEKILRFVRAMAQERQRYDELLEKGDAKVNSKDVKKTAERYNELRKEAMKARWELLVHRQAVGFIVDNHSTVARHFPIGGPLPLSIDENESSDDHGDVEKHGKGEAKKEKFGTQTDWWQRIGRWR